MSDTLKRLYQVVEDRQSNPQEGSYTCYLLDKGLDKILKKVGEECSETIIELDQRSAKIGNLKQFHISDHNT